MYQVYKNKCKYPLLFTAVDFMWNSQLLPERFFTWKFRHLNVCSSPSALRRAARVLTWHYKLDECRHVRNKCIQINQYKKLCILFSGAQACVLSFSTVDRDSFEAIESWKRKVGHSSHNCRYLVYKKKNSPTRTESCIQIYYLELSFLKIRQKHNKESCSTKPWQSFNAIYWYAKFCLIVICLPLVIQIVES